MLETISTQRSDIADRRKELAVFKNLKIIDKGFKAALQEGDCLLSRIETEQRKIIKINDWTKNNVKYAKPPLINGKE
jgi:hypothetical protein